MKFRCRMVLPTSSDWKEMEAETQAEAVNNFHDGMVDALRGGFKLPVREGERLYYIHFARIETEGLGELISRIYVYGLWRRGGVRRTPEPTVADAAKAVGWTGDPNELLEEGWEGEESYEECQSRP